MWHSVENQQINPSASFKISKHIFISTVWIQFPQTYKDCFGVKINELTCFLYTNNNKEINSKLKITRLVT